MKDIAEDKLQESDVLRAALIHPYDLIQASVSGGVEITDDVIDPLEAVYYSVEHATGVVAHLAMVEIITPEVDEAGPGEGYLAIARMIGEFVIAQKRQMGQINESQEEQERDRLGGITMDEKVMLDNG